MSETMPPLQVDHVAGTHRCYPGESTAYYTRVQVHQAVAGYTVTVSLPREMELESMRVLSGQPAGDVITGRSGAFTGDRTLTWTFLPVDGELTGCELAVEVRIPHGLGERLYTSTVRLSDLSLQCQTMASASVFSPDKGQYIYSLPALYHKDEFLGRFLMLIESMWEPMELQIDQMSENFDPRLTPSAMLPWLAAWFDLNNAFQWPEDRFRALVRQAVQLYRMNGTRRGLETVLELYTGRKPRIIEHRARSFCLGPANRLGTAVALGHQTQPHTFTVRLSLPPLEGLNESDMAAAEDQRRLRIERLIESYKPAFTAYRLELEIDPAQVA